MCIFLHIQGYPEGDSLILCIFLHIQGYPEGVSLILGFIPYVEPALRIIFPLLLVHFTVLGKGQSGGNHSGSPAFVAVNFFPPGYCCNASAFRADKHFHHMSLLTFNSVFYLCFHSIVALNWKKGKFKGTCPQNYSCCSVLWFQCIVTFFQ